MKIGKKYLILISIAVILFMVGAVLSYIDNSKRVERIPGGLTVVPEKRLNLSKDDVLVSFRIDDITFKKGQKEMLENALYLGRKYNVTFELAVIAKQFDEGVDPETFKIYQDNPDIFEVVAHGLTHSDYQNESCHSRSCFIEPVCGEFKCAPYAQQEDRLRKVKEIFQRRNLFWGTKIIFLPWSAGDANTIEAAKKEGYLVLSQEELPKDYHSNNENLLILDDGVSVDMKEVLTAQDLTHYRNKFNSMVKNNRTEIMIIFHQVNFEKISGSEELIKEIREIQQNGNSKIKFGMVSEGVRRDS